ncbi:DUF4148 domain-containing protein [Paraburkholderia elongata]|uniref:DUF4148 domain-containing protein n=1 Tax=Paraburkholderia elongata TaxID=2675747 RepID=A0A972NY67_9BURK|nr:DUF4148 domain-containing protein [Paraburkholderia elongata]NPT61072.1 DUF4148 domain-containing protein [Paraburkholderia elongata]
MESESLNRCADSPLLSLVMAGAVLMASSASVYAQAMPEPATHQLTRAEVMHELEELEAAGYNPSQGDDGSYPADLQAAEEKVAAKHRAERDAVMNAGQNGPAKPSP